MASAEKNLSEFDASNLPDATDLKIGIVVSEWNKEITHALYDGCLSTLLEQGVPEENIYTVQVPGSFELPVAAKMLLSRRTPDAVICLGCVIQGETRHNEYINQSVAQGLVNLGMASGTPCIFGMLTTDSLEQAKDRAGGKHGNKGVEAAATALRMAALKKGLARAEKRIGFSSTS